MKGARLVFGMRDYTYLKVSIRDSGGKGREIRDSNCQRDTGFCEFDKSSSKELFSGKKREVYFLE